MHAGGNPWVLTSGVCSGTKAEASTFFTIGARAGVFGSCQQE